MDRTKLILAACLFIFSHLVCASEIHIAIEDAAQSHQWRTLLHYERSLFLDDKSAISSSDFFFSDTGSVDPLSELNANLTAFIDTPELQCQFPARAQFIKRKVAELPEVKCPDFEDFVATIGAKSVSLIYASGYLGNPASMYGHVFLKFNGTRKSELLDNTYNYGARYPKNEHPIRYIMNGIFGGYDGYFANQKFHHQTLTYNESELRDLWEYSLDFTQDDITFLLGHLWELEQVPMTYYFFKQNCAYQIAYLLSMLTGTSYIPESKLWVMPFDIVTQIERVDPTLIDKVFFHPSRQETLYSRFSQLSSHERSVFEDLLKGVLKPSEIVTLLSEHEAKRVIEAAFDYFAYIEQHDSLTSTMQSLRKALVNIRFSLPVGQSRFEKPAPKAPHEAQDTSLLQISTYFNNSLNSGLTFRFRANYYDFLTLNAARIPFSELSTVDMSVRLDEDANLHLADLTFLRIFNLNAARTELTPRYRICLEACDWVSRNGPKPRNSCVLL
ncbi:Lnb N-terminal periplasmic domain-containing protein [Alteromonas gracilis]|uniref:Lnb N-terminal periplasmic domain-containing protein n=1 Tax=Alteromonas gracilis TaxID=1479524 RepID=UPI00321C0D24